MVWSVRQGWSLQLSIQQPPANQWCRWLWAPPVPDISGLFYMALCDTIDLLISMGSSAWPPVWYKRPLDICGLFCLAPLWYNRPLDIPGLFCMPPCDTIGPLFSCQFMREKIKNRHLRETAQGDFLANVISKGKVHGARSHDTKGKAGHAPGSLTFNISIWGDMNPCLHLLSLFPFKLFTLQAKLTGHAHLLT